MAFKIVKSFCLYQFYFYPKMTEVSCDKILSRISFIRFGHFYVEMSFLEQRIIDKIQQLLNIFPRCLRKGLVKVRKPRWLTRDSKYKIRDSISKLTNKIIYLNYK